MEEKMLFEYLAALKNRSRKRGRKGIYKKFDLRNRKYLTEA